MPGHDDDPRPAPPEKPAPAECCEAGCDPCVFDVYAEALDAYRIALALWLERHPGDGTHAHQSVGF